MQTPSCENIKKIFRMATNRLQEQPLSDRFEIIGFHHLEFYCTDAKSVMKAIRVGFGMDLLAHTGTKLKRVEGADSM